MSRFKTVTHIFAIVVAGLAAFVVSPAGQALVKQYPYLSGFAGIVIAVSAVYHSPRPD